MTNRALTDQAQGDPALAARMHTKQAQGDQAQVELAQVGNALAAQTQTAQTRTHQAQTGHALAARMHTNQAQSDQAQTGDAQPDHAPAATGIARNGWATLARTMTQIAQELSAGLSSALAEVGLSLDEWHALESIIRLGSGTMGEIAHATGMPNATLSRVIDGLEDSASAYRVVDAADRRRITVRLSDLGLTRLDLARAVVSAWEDSTDRRLGSGIANELGRAIAGLSAG